MNAKKLWILLILLFLPVPAFAAGKMHFEALEVHPFVAVAETYNDNIFAVSSDKTSDWITKISPGIKLLLPYRAHKFSVDYRADINLYANTSSENTTDHYANAIADLQLSSLFGLKLSDTYINGHEPRYSSAYGQIEKFTKHAPSVTATYQLATLSKVQIDYTRAIWDFTVNNFRTRQEDLVAAYLYYRFLPRTSAFVEYDFGNYMYDRKENGLDSKNHNAFLGLTWEMTAITKGTVKAGYIEKRFNAAVMEGFQTWAASLDVSHAFSDYSSIKLVGKREINESIALGSRYYVTTGAYAEYTHRLTTKISGVARLAYGVDDYSNAIGDATVARIDKTIFAGVGLKYQMVNWLEFSLDFYHRNRDSNIPVWNLVQNLYTFTITFAL
jgi:hypothetical protein